MSNLAINDPSRGLWRTRLIQVHVEEPPERLNAFVAFPSGGGVLFGMPSRDREVHYHLVAQCPKGSTAWRLVLLRTWEPLDGRAKKHDRIWQTPLISADDLGRWMLAVGRRFQGMELLAGSLRAGGFGIATLESLEAEGWLGFSSFATFFQKVRTKKRVRLTNEDVILPAPRGLGQPAPDVLILDTPDADELQGMAFRLRTKPRGEGAALFGLSDDSDPNGEQAYYLYCRTTILKWLVDLLTETGEEVLHDRGLREQLRHIREAIAASRRGIDVDWKSLLSF